MSRHRVRPAPGAPQGRRSIRASLIALAVVPSVAMVLLWITGSAVQLVQWQRASDEGNPARTTYALVPGVSEFQKERRLTLGVLSAHGDRAALLAQRRRTDAVLADFRTADESSGEDGSARYRGQLDVVREQIAEVRAERLAVDRGKATRQHTYDVYSRTVASVLNLFGMLDTDNGSAATAAEAGHALAFLRATEALSQEEAILDGVTATRRATVQERTDLVSAAAVRVSVLSDEVTPYLPTASRAALEKVIAGADWADLAAYEKAVGTAAPAADGSLGITRPTAARAAAAGRVSEKVLAVQNRYLPSVTENSDARNRTLLGRMLTGSALALVAVVAVALLSWRITRSLLGRMTELRAQTLELAQDRLPELIGRLRTEGSRADLVELPELDFGSDELGKVAQAFNTAQRTAVNVALEQASLREGARLVFHNMSRRIQILVHRQLTVIDDLERKEQDPQLLAGLYRVDHLATRMRRNAESLTVLSGAAPRRRWKHAVPLADLVRSAVSEIEGYVRVVVEPMPPVAVSGPAVGDTIHLLAELIENGVTFSPPHTEVRVRALLVAQGYAVEVEDRGLGLSAQEYEAANELLHEPRDFSFSALGQDPRLGLFTVGHLARRHGITSSLQPSSYGGTLAVVVLPQALVEPATDTAPPVLDARAERHLSAVSTLPDDHRPPNTLPPRTRRTPATPAFTATTTPVPNPDGSLDAPHSVTGAARDVVGRDTMAARDGVDRDLVGRDTMAARGAMTRGAFKRGPAPEGVPAQDAPPRPAPAPVAAPRPGGPGSGRLPRRVRQAHLAPQLRERPQESYGDSGPVPERRPEQARAMLAALRDGTRRARAQEEVPVPDWPPVPPGRRPLPTRPRPTRNTTS
ncbi:nitrate- and nitrite sensing domain-containing protein [Streptomyces sp. NPDC047072]|uniref:sensor histidine kinase n=1 Tax=Streptomyces sp. NPDC047072 TaxID=3154809 RepID=UPI0033CFCABE